MSHGEVQNDHQGIAREEKAYVELPEIRRSSNEDVQANYMRIKKEVLGLVNAELEKLPRNATDEKGKRKKKLGQKK